MNSGPGPRTPRTPFSIADILGPRAAPTGQPPERGPASPLCALEELTSVTLGRLDGRRPRPSEGTALGGAAGSGPRPAGRRPRKSRTAFTAQQVRELERRFGSQKYLAPAERDRLAARLGLGSEQVVTWFQNRRAKLRRDLQELRADLASLCVLGPQASAGPAPPTPRPAAHAEEEEVQVDG
ncbi:transcription factor LBX2 [Erinaceus europaeus]|uniref:Transcription factor LBX2 n=1 Tax=Erinaceus europaeus TaxID=9365 RepID=A0A1S2ZRH6_ERIEU|nr:transcription factor LBX2 [Erinaceus europaeus]